MTAEIDIFRAAQALIRRHGEEAPLQAAMRLDACSAAGDLAGAAVWKRILSAIDALLAAGPPAGRAVH